MHPVLALTLGMLPFSWALICYENDEKGNVKEVSNDQWSYCAFIPESEHTNGRMFGLGKEVDNLEVYDVAFKQSDDLYKVLTLCVYEKYELDKLSPRFGRPEFMFRCVCNYNRCNAHKTFQRYLTGIRADNE
ncbi:unnamed protein product [Nippostrongylus brasiliensis]|uniref:Uncharacterized protein n=1 Tax=Nippostrongylus brasiliensis TaxID=27835 RepID=A0A0N4XCD1_NIPBR|nr:hypothetical protein Q1695_001813 [Nippostrongylus brasiliensis]VDL62189.1 unnamed protein product [Nippostrongylus brasiliensis]